MSATRSLSLIAALALSACDASITEGKPRPIVTPAAITPPEQPVARLHRLTEPEFDASVRALLGDGVPLAPTEVDVDVDGFATVGASQLSISPAGVEAYEGVLGAATAAAFATDQGIGHVLGCAPTTLTDPCIRDGLARFGRRAFRRPLTQLELSTYYDFVLDTGGDANDVRVGLRSAVWAILQSPSFLYRVELGEAVADKQGRHAYTGYEMASRLAAVLWASAPDEALLDAADAQLLSTADGVRAQATRMMADPRARSGFGVYIDDLYNAEHLANAIKDTAIFPEWSPALQTAMHDEMVMRVDDLVFDHPTDFLSLYDSSTTFVNADLAPIYGVMAPASGYAQVTLPANRRGLLGSGAVLASYALPQRTSPTQRGRFVAEQLLCKTVPPPPPSVITTIDQTPDAGTLRAQLEAHRANPACASCHALMDPIGLGLEEFDGVGVHRDTDRGLPIDASGVLDGVAFQNAAGLASALRAHPKAGPCFIQKLYTFAQGRSVMPVDGLALATLAAKFKTEGNRADQAVIDLVSSDAFRFIEPD